MTLYPRLMVCAGMMWGLAALSAPPAEAGMLYVRTSGDDANSGATPAVALRTVGRAAALAAADDIVVVGPGTYVEGNITPAAFGRVRFVADRQGVLVGQGAGDVVIDATGFTTGFEFNRQLAMGVDGFVIYGASVGIYVKTSSHGAVVSNNVVCNNNTNGIYVQDSRDAVIFNNLVYNNGRTGILLRGDTSAAANAKVINNTVYLNLNRGIFFSSGATFGAPNGLVLNNVVVRNRPNGIQVNVTSRTGYLSAGNVVFENNLPSPETNFFTGTPVDVTDVRADPKFVDPDGADDALGGAHYADDQFQLGERRAGQVATSAAIDAGSDLARRLSLAGGSTRTDRKHDRGIVDAGYHYDNFTAPPASPAQRLRYKSLYVNGVTGDDANDGNTPATAWRTLRRAFDAASPGHRIVIVGGTYREGNLAFPSSGRPQRPIVVQAVNGAVIDGSGAQTGLVLNAVSHLLLDGIAVSGATDNGIEIRFSQAPGAPEADNIVLRRVRLSSNGSRGLSVRNSVGVVMTSSIVENNGTRGIQVENAAMRIERSVIGNNTLTGLWAFGGSSVAVSNTQFNENRRDNVLVEESDVSIVGGVVRGGTEGGARFKAGSTGMLEGVTVLDNVDVGVQAVSSVVSLSGGSVSGSRIGVQAFVDPVLQLPAELAVEDTTICNNDDNGVDVDHATLTLIGADVCANGQDGLRQRGGSAIVDGGTVRSNLRGGISSSDADSLSVRGLTVQSNGANGVQIARGGAFVIEDSRLFDNSGDGVTVLDTAVPQIVNNLVYRNGSDGIRVSGDSVGSPDAFVIHNTVFGNASRGLIVGGSDLASSSPNASVMRNIFRGNGSFGIQVTTLSIIGYRGNYNLNTDPYGAPSLVGVNDMQVNPQFVQPESGDFHLSQTASGQPSTSPAVDAGGMNATAAGMDRKTTRTDGVTDRGIVDLGYHYIP